ncbi:MAG TPA: Hpt domain-containing protein [Candidatus Baltobacteraceae bacterium]|nr:Hpt domain-containing protein [Candidatus Baltobacteraceae bacterium]
MPDKAILDIWRLEEAFEDDTAGIAELLELALQTGEKHRRALAEALAANDAAGIARAAHGIKGSAGNIGANVVYRLATELDQRARAGDISDAAERIRAIDEAYEGVAEQVADYRRTVAGT